MKKCRKEEGIGILYLNKCIDDDNYKKALTNFFNEVEINDINKIAVDLRKNNGGNSLVINEFLSYLNVDEFKGYKDKSANYDPSTFEITHKDSKLYDGKVYIIISKATFSSAN